ncbi:MAG: MBL fold metallo-hydrolase [Clostridiales bacterium]|nr:MBL fold metallo-hydrolase [Clostridiales bacterium]
MKITVLMDNYTYIDRYYLGEPAAAYLLETGEKTILLDTGYSAVTLENARRMGIDLSRVTDVVISHGHNDHTGGLIPFLEAHSQKVKIHLHPDALLKKRFDGLDVGIPFDPAALPGNAKLCLSNVPKEIAKNVLFLGEIPRVNPLEAPAVGETDRRGVFEPDYLLDDTALALRTADGLFILTGCSHAGICNMVQYASALTGERRIAGILGGLHLFDPGPQVDFVIERLAALGVKKLYPCHCTSLAVKTLLAQHFDVAEVGVGFTLTV